MCVIEGTLICWKNNLRHDWKEANESKEGKFEMTVELRRKVNADLYGPRDRTLFLLCLGFTPAL